VGRIVRQLLLDDEVPTALVELALVEVPLPGDKRELTGIFTIRDTAKHLPGSELAQRTGMHAVVVAGAHLPEVLIGTVLGCDVEDGLELPGRHVVSQELRAGVLLNVQRVRTGVAPVPALTIFPAECARRIEERTAVRHLTAALAVTKERWPAAAAI